MEHLKMSDNNMNGCLITIVVPMYNSSRTIGRLLDSFYEQTSDLFTVIIVDDGSEDNSVDVVEGYSNRIKGLYTVCLDHKGVSDARNAGIDNVKTPYLMFADADDELEENAIQYITGWLIGNKYDWVFFDHINVLFDGRTNDRKENLRLSEDIHYAFASDYKMNPIWNRVYRTDVIKKNGIRFNPAYVKGEDFLFNLDYCKCVGGRFVSFNYPLYRYRCDNNESVIHRFKIEDFDTYVGLYRETIKYLNEVGKDNDKYILAARQRLLNEVIKYLYDLSMSSRTYKEASEVYKQVYKDHIIRECIKEWKNGLIKCDNRKECMLILHEMYYFHRSYIRIREFCKRYL